MKFKFSVILSMLMFSYLKNYSQDINHSTISDVNVSYKTSMLSTNNTPSAGVKVEPKIVVNLIADTLIKKVYVKMLNKNNNAVLYQVNYDINNSPVVDENGRSLFIKTDNALEMIIPQIIDLGSCVFILNTEDKNNALSEDYLQNN